MFKSFFIRKQNERVIFNAGFKKAEKEGIRNLIKREKVLKKEYEADKERMKVAFLNRLKSAEKEMKKEVNRAKKSVDNAKNINEELHDIILYFLNAATNFKNAKDYSQKRAAEDYSTTLKILAEFETLFRNYKKKQKKIRTLLEKSNVDLDNKYITWEESNEENE